MQSRFNSLANVVTFLLLVTGLAGSARAQTFLDRRNPDSVRVVSYNVYFNRLFQNASQNSELGRLISSVGADIYNFQETAQVSAGYAQGLFDSLAPLPGGDNWKVHKAGGIMTVSRYDLSMTATSVPGGVRGIAMAQVDLPDENFSNDLFILNNHFACCTPGEPSRQFESAAIADWVIDATTPGGDFDLAPGTAISILGDLNTVGGPIPLDTLLHGKEGLPPDWDGTSLADAHPLHNAVGPDDWTWQDDRTPYAPSILDYVLFTDSVLQMDHGYVLNPKTMTEAELQATGLQATDFYLATNAADHLPLVVDFVPVSTSIPEPSVFAGLALTVSVVGMRRRRKND